MKEFDGEYPAPTEMTEAVTGAFGRVTLAYHGGIYQDPTCTILHRYQSRSKVGGDRQGFVVDYRITVGLHVQPRPVSLEGAGIANHGGLS